MSATGSLTERDKEKTLYQTKMFKLIELIELIELIDNSSKLTVIKA
jgi:hypothetical protein